MIHLSGAALDKPACRAEHERMRGRGGGRKPPDMPFHGTCFVRPRPDTGETIPGAAASISCVRAADAPSPFCAASALPSLLHWWALGIDPRRGPSESIAGYSSHDFSFAFAFDVWLLGSRTDLRLIVCPFWL